MTPNNRAAAIVGLMVAVTLIAVAFGDSLTVAIAIAVAAALVTAGVRRFREHYLDRQASRDETPEP
jgi:hypothetical protein